MMSDEDFLHDYKRRTLKEHVTLGRHKAVSYLPLTTIERVLGLTVDEYRREVEQAGNECLVLSEDETCIRSGAVYAYSRSCLAFLLEEYSGLLSTLNWPRSPETFIRKIAAHWYAEDEPIMPLVRAAFGDGASSA